MNPRTRILRQSRRALAPSVDRMESRQLLSTIHEPVHGAVLAHHHEALRPHHAAVVERAHPGHHGAPRGATPATVTGLQVIAQPSNVALGATTAISDNDIWAVGSTTSGTVPQPVAMQFNGTSWNAVPVPTLSNGGYFSGVAGTASNDVWAVGASPAYTDPLIEHWNGASWSVVSSPALPSGSVLSAVTAVSSTNVWAVGENGNLTGDLVEHWNGTSWSVVSSPAFHGANDILDSISANASNDVWAVGGDIDVGGAVMLHFNGTSWSRTNTPDTPGEAVGLHAVTALSPTNVWAVGRKTGYKKNNPSGQVIDHWDGTSWSLISSPAPNPNVNLNGIAAISANDIWAVGINASNEQTITEHWDGTSWSVIACPDPVAVLEDLGGVTALSDGTVVAVGYATNSSNITNGLILMS
jgi:hypothetical protein